MVLGGPGWVRDAGFDPAFHVRTLSLAGVGADDVLELAPMLEAAPFDPDRPPWDITLIHGLDGGRAAIFARAQQVMGVGRGGLSFLDVLLDEPVWGSAATSAAPDARDRPGGGAGGRRRGTFTLTVDLPGVARPFAAGIAALTVDPLATVAGGVRHAIERTCSVARQAVVPAPRLSPLVPSRAFTSRFAVVSVEGARTAALALGGSRNDLLIAACAAGLGEYHERLGLHCPALRAATTSRGAEFSLGRSWLMPTLVEVPADADHPGPQFGVVAAGVGQARRAAGSRLMAALMTLFAGVPTPAFVPVLHAQARSIDFAAASLPGLRGARHIGGATVLSSYPFGPRLGSLMNASAFGNDERLDIGLALDPVVIEQPDVLVECVVDAFHALGAGGRGASVTGIGQFTMHNHPSVVPN
jgi:hypothetical protein